MSELPPFHAVHVAALRYALFDAPVPVESDQAAPTPVDALRACLLALSAAADQAAKALPR